MVKHCIRQNLQTVYTDCRSLPAVRINSLEVLPSPSRVRSSGCCGGFGLGVGFAVCRFLCGGPQHPVSRDPVHDLASAKGHEWLATCVPVQDMLSQGILSSSTTCGISGCSVKALHVIAIWW